MASKIIADEIEGNSDPTLVTTYARFAIADQSWYAGHLVLGEYHIWTDENGKLRIKRGAPLWDEDGELFLMQSDLAQGKSGYSGLSGYSGIPGDRYTTSSSQSKLIQTGAVSLTDIGSGLAFATGHPIIIAYSATNKMEGTCISYSGTTIIVDVTSTTGSGTYSAWQVSLSGGSGPQGVSGISGYSGRAGPAWLLPVGFVFISVVNTDPATLLGYGSWLQFGIGKFMVGHDDSQGSPFCPGGKTGGSKTKDFSHTHDEESHNHEFTLTDDPDQNWSDESSQFGPLYSAGVKFKNQKVYKWTNHGGGHGSQGGHGNADILPPFVVVHMWKRIA